MRIATMVSLLVMAQLGWAASASGRTAAAERQLILIPTALEELNELRVNTGQKAVLSDGTMNAVYVKKFPAAADTYLNFHVDISSGAGPVVLHADDIRLQRAVIGATSPQSETRQGKATLEALARGISYTPMDWFLDTGLAEERGEALTVHNKTIVQFTIEVPREGRDDLTLFVRSQRIGTVREIRARIASVGESG
jgi:hypothetical protein